MAHGRWTLPFVALAVLSGGAARAQPSPELPDLEWPEVGVEVELRAYAVLPKFRFRDGREGHAGSSLRTQKLGLDRTEVSLGGRAALWLDGTDRVALELWTLSAGGQGRTEVPLRFDGAELRAGSVVATQYALTYASVEYVHRLSPFVDWFWVDLGARVEYLDFRVSVGGAGRLGLEAVWPTARVHVGVRPFEWLELEGRFGGFELTFSTSRTRVSQPYEVGGAVRVHLPHRAYLELGFVMQHVHLEEAPGEPEEDALHLRHRAVLVALGVAF